jgi:DNA-binding transcriptional LysR family regulator
MIGDELFVPNGSGMQPTRRARELALVIQEGLQNFQLALMAKTLVPAEADRSFRIAASDGITALVLPALLQRLVKSAPNVDLKVFPSNRIDVVRQPEADQRPAAILQTLV